MNPLFASQINRTGGTTQDLANDDTKRPLRQSHYEGWNSNSGKQSSYLKALLTVLIFTGIAQLMSNSFELSNVVMTYLLGVVIVAGCYGRGPAIVSSILSVAAFDFFFVPPRLTFAVSDTQYLVTFAVMLVVAIVISTLTARIRQQAETAMIREQRTSALYSLSKELACNLDEQSIIATGLRHIRAVFDCEAELFLAGKDGTLQACTTPQAAFPFDSGVALWVHENRCAAGLGTNTLPGMAALYVPIVGARQPLGVIAVCPNRKSRFASPEQQKLLEAFGNQMALAFERALLSAENELSRLQVKTEQLRNSLLSSVSHDLRTPLATITGAASSILGATDRMNLETCRAMVDEIYHESIRLNRLVANLLDMTKLQSANLEIKKQLHPLEEIVGASLSCMEDRLSKHQIKTGIPTDLPFIRVDAILIQQLLVNLIENAVKYTPDGSIIEISATSSGNHVTVFVADNGPGIPEALHKKVFEMFFREPHNSVSGTGLGLAICAGIMEAHGGSIKLENRQGGGSVFSFILEGMPEELCCDDADDRSDGDG